MNSKIILFVATILLSYISFAKSESDSRVHIDISFSDFYSLIEENIKNEVMNSIAAGESKLPATGKAAVKGIDDVPLEDLDDEVQIDADAVDDMVDAAVGEPVAEDDKEEVPEQNEEEAAVEQNDEAQADENDEEAQVEENVDAGVIGEINDEDKAEDAEQQNEQEQTEENNDEAQAEENNEEAQAEENVDAGIIGEGEITNAENEDEEVITEYAEYDDEEDAEEQVKAHLEGTTEEQQQEDETIEDAEIEANQQLENENKGDIEIDDNAKFAINGFEDVKLEGEGEEEEKSQIGDVVYVKVLEPDNTIKAEPITYNVSEGEQIDEDTVRGVVEEEKEEGSHVLGASIAIVGAFGLVAGFGYKYTRRNKRIVLPFHEDDLLERGEFYDKSAHAQEIIPVWAAAKKDTTTTTEAPKDTSSVDETLKGDEQEFEVVYNYEPELPDELKLTAGDKIMIKEIYEDGWAYGYNKTTQLFGTFPSTSFGEDFNAKNVPQYKPEDGVHASTLNDEMVEDLKKKIVESNN